MSVNATVTELAQRMEQTADYAQFRIHQLMQQPDTHCTDLGNAYRFVKKYGEQIRYCKATDTWFIWDGQRYAPDDSLAIYKLAHEITRLICLEAAQCTSDTDRKELMSWAMQSENLSRQTAMINSARSLVPIKVSELDADPYLFNVQNGVIDLRTGKLLPHDPSRLITKLAPVTYDIKAKCPTWQGFLNRIMDGNENLIEFLQRAIGYSMTGSVNEEILLFLYGNGANGKSVLLNTLLALFGDYGQPTDPELLTAKKNESHPVGVADLVGARLAVTNELEDGRRLAENLVKQLTGGDMLKARFMHQNFFAFKPSFTLWMAGNHRPVVRGQDEGIWRRIRLIPFTVTIPPEERDPRLKDKLQAEASGILNWMLEGCVKYLTTGLTYPDEVKHAVDEYRADSDPVGDFFSEVCIISADEEVTVGDLYRTYNAWCDENGQRPFSSKRFTSLIMQKYPDVERVRTKTTRIWKGIGLIGDRMTDGDTFSEKHNAYIRKNEFTEKPSPPVTRHQSYGWGGEH